MPAITPAAVAEGLTQLTEIAQSNSAAVHYLVGIWSVISGFLIIIGLTFALFSYAWYVGYGQLIGLLLSFYLAYGMYAAFPYLDYLPQSPPWTALAAHIGFYIALVVVFKLILNRITASDFLGVGTMGVLILCFTGAAFLFALAFHVFQVPDLYHFTPAISRLFAPDQFFFWWFISPAVALFVWGK